MVNFVGVVTQQDVQTGVTLRARVTSPKGHYTAYQDFRCMVKQVGLSDEQAVVTDLNTVSNKLLANGVVTGITENITGYMPANGENETNIRYVVTGDDISEYINNDGIVIKRPAYGSNAVIGTLTITVSKNSAVAERNITISIEPYTVEEITQFALSSITWDSIRGNNKEETTDPSTNGMYNVIYPLALTKTVPSEMIETPIVVTWSIEQDILSDVISEERININTGAIARPAYSVIQEAKDVQISSSMVEVITSRIENSSKDLTYMRINGLVLRADISIDGDTIESGTVRFNLKTLSSALTNKEVASYLTDNISIFSIKDTNYNTTFALASFNDETEREVFYDTTGVNSSTLSLFGPDRILSSTVTNELTNSGLKTVIGWRVADPDTVDTTPTFISATEYSSSDFRTNGTEVLLTLDPATAPTRTKLVLRSQIQVKDYNGSSEVIELYFRFVLIDATPTTSGDTSGSGTTTTT